MRLRIVLASVYFENVNCNEGAWNAARKKIAITGRITVETDKNLALIDKKNTKKLV